MPKLYFMHLLISRRASLQGFVPNLVSEFVPNLGIYHMDVTNQQRLLFCNRWRGSVL